MTVQATRTRVPRTENVRVRLTAQERELVAVMMEKDFQASEGAFLRSLILQEARRRQLVKEGK